MGTLRRRAGAPDDTYDVTGSLDGIRPGSRNVRHLSVRRLTAGATEGLRPLVAFGSLEVLELVDVVGVDLSPLADVEVASLQLTSVDAVDLAPLAVIDSLRDLGIAELRNCRIPERLSLPPTLESLHLANEARGPVAALLAAIDWRRLGNLRALDVRVLGGDPTRVDGAFLRHLTRLERLRLEPGVWLDPPIDVLPKALRSISVDAWEPEQVRESVRQQLPEAHVLVAQRYGSAPGVEPWAILPPDAGDEPPEWSAYGSLCDAAADDLETEHEALRAARRRLRAADAALLARLDFDQEADGTSIVARTREDLERALTILALR